MKIVLDLLVLAVAVTFLLESACSLCILMPENLHVLFSLHPPPLLHFQYVVAERKYSMILGLAFQFRCIFMGRAECQHWELLG